MWFRNVLALTLLGVASLVQATEVMLGHAEIYEDPSNRNAILLARDATDCLKWSYLPSRWKPVSRLSTSYVRRNQSGQETAHFIMNYVAEHETLNVENLKSYLSNRVRELIAIEQDKINRGVLKGEDAFYAGKCATEGTPTVEAFRMDRIGAWARTIEGNHVINGRYVYDESSNRTHLELGVTVPLEDAWQYVALFGDRVHSLGDGISPQFKAVHVAADLSVALDSHMVANFAQTVHRTHTCTDHCWRFWFFRGCHTRCNWHTETVQFLTGISQSARAELDSDIRTDLISPRELAQERQILLNTVFARNFGERVSAAQSHIVQIEPGNMARSSSESLRESRRVLKVTDLRFVRFMKSTSAFSPTVLQGVVDNLIERGIRP